MTQTEQLPPPTYANANVSATSVPSYSAATITTLPSKFPVTLTVHNADKVNAHVSLTHDELLVAQLSLSHAAEDAEFAAEAKLVIASTHVVPFAVRRHVPSSSYEIIALDAEGAHGRCRKLTTKGLLFKNKYAFEGLAGRQWAWKGNLNRTLSLFDYPAEGDKQLLAEYVKCTTGPAMLHIESLPADAQPTEAFSLIFASLYALIDMHRDPHRPLHHRGGPRQAAEGGQALRLGHRLPLSRSGFRQAGKVQGSAQEGA